MSTRFQQIVAVVVLVGFLVAVVLAPGLVLKHKAAQLIGAPEADVIAELGTPDSVITAQNVAQHPSSRWLAEGWAPVPARPVTNKVLVYYSMLAGAAVYLDGAGRVEYVQIVER